MLLRFESVCVCACETVACQYKLCVKSVHFALWAPYVTASKGAGSGQIYQGSEAKVSPLS